MVVVVEWVRVVEVKRSAQEKPPVALYKVIPRLVL
jgi:hypothetical protein